MAKGPAFADLPGYGYVITPGLVALFFGRRPLLTKQFGTRYPMMMLGIACLVFAVVLRLKIRKHLTITTLAHLPNLVAVRYLNMLLIEDIDL